MPVFNLELQFDDKGALKAARVLDSVADSAKVAEQGLKKVEKEADGASSGLKKIENAASALANSVQKTDAKAKGLISSISKFSSTRPVDAIIKQFDDVGIKINRSSKEIQNIAARMGKLAQENAFKTLANDAKLSAFQIAKIRMGMGDVRGAMSSLGGVLKSSGVGVLALTASFVGVGKAILDAQIQLERLEQSYKSVFGETGASQLQMIYEQTEKVGQQYFEVAEAAKTFFAAGRDTTLANELDDIFKVVSNTGAALQLSTEQVKGTFVALGQMISKGKVQAEELRGQLGERLPGAFQMAAKAMNMTTAELDKFMADGKLTAEELLPKLAEVLEEKYAKAAENAANTAQGSINRMSTAWTLFKSNVMESDGMIAMINAVTDALNAFNDNATKARENSRIDKELAERGINPAGRSTKYYAWGGSSETTYYTEQQRDIIRIEERQRAYLEELEKAEEKQAEKNLAAGRSRLESAYNNTLQGKLARKQQELEELQKAAENLFREQAKQNVDSSDDRKKFQVAEKALQDEIRELEKRSAATSQGSKPSTGTTGVSSDVKDQLAIEEALQAARDKSSKEAEKLAQKEQENLQVRADFYRELSQLSGDYGLSLEYQNQLIQQQAKAWEAAGVPQADVQRRIELMEQELARDPWSGFVRGARKWAAETQDLASGVEQALTNAFDGAADSLANFVMTGKINFQSLANSIISDLARIAAQQAIGGIVGGLVGGLGSAIGGWFSGGSTAAGTTTATNAAATAGNMNSLANSFSFGFHSGGMAWEKPDFTRTVPAALFADAPRFHNGRFYDPSYEIPAIIRKDESVLTPGQMRAIAGAGGTSHVTVNVVNQTSTPVEAEAQATPDGNGGFDLTMILREVDRGMVGLAKSGRSSFTQMIEKSYGLNRAGVLARGRR